MSVIDDTKKSMDESVEYLKKELSSLRTARANPSMLDGIKVEVYGSQMRLKDIANVTTPESRQLLITPYDANNANVISKAIENSDVNLQARVDGSVVRIDIPPMDEARRKEIAKQVWKEAEAAKISIRDARRKANDNLKKEKQDGDITEDEQKGGEKKIQKLTDESCKTVDEVCSKKEKEILAV